MPAGVLHLPWRRASRLGQMTGTSPPFHAPTGNAEQALHAAILALQGQRPDEAERIAADVLKREPRHPVAAGILGRAMMLQNRAAEAIPVLEQAARTKASWNSKPR